MNDTTAETREPQEYGWCILELMGHRVRIGKVTEQLVANVMMLRVDIPAGDEYVSEFYSGSSVYGMQPVSEEIARRETERRDPRPTRPLEYQPAPQLEDRSDGLGEEDYY